MRRVGVRSGTIVLEVTQKLDSAVLAVEVPEDLDFVLCREPVQVRSVPDEFHGNVRFLVLIVLAQHNLSVCSRAQLLEKMIPVFECSEALRSHHNLPACVL